MVVVMPGIYIAIVYMLAYAGRPRLSAVWALGAVWAVAVLAAVVVMYPFMPLF
jgi:hypothetical protein